MIGQITFESGYSFDDVVFKLADGSAATAN